MSRAVIARPPTQTTTFHGIVTGAPQMRAFFALATKVARTDSTVLIRGETGTGKELAARMLAALGRRKGKPYRALNCATLTSDLLASELFGHVRGSFTGAIKDRLGLFALANHGTIFLDEIAELPLEIQARLLRVLQERTFVPVGATEPVSVDVRLLSATNKSLRNEVAERRFREDLMYRVRVVPVFLPPLRERTGDVDALFWHFVGVFNADGVRDVRAVASEALDALRAYEWPGNVRELRNVVEYAFAVGEGPTILLSELTPELRGERPRLAPGEAPTMRELERERIVAALRQAEGKRAIAAQLLGMSRSTLWRKLKEHQIAL